MKKSETVGKLSKAMSEYLSEVTNPKATSENPYFKSKFAPLDSILELVRPILSKYELSIFQDVSGNEGTISVSTTIVHSSGEWMETEQLLMKPTKNDCQGQGSAISYARRYQISAILGIAADIDEDGNGACNNTNDSKGSNQGQTPRTSNHIKSQNKPQNEAKESELRCIQCNNVTEAKFYNWNNLGLCDGCIKQKVEIAKAVKVAKAKVEAE